MPIFHPAYLLRNQSKEEGTPMSLTKLDFLKIKEKIEAENFQKNSVQKINLSKLIF